MIGESFYHAGPEEAEEQLQEGDAFMAVDAVVSRLGASISCMLVATEGVQKEISGMDTEMTETKSKMAGLKKVC